MTSWKKQYEPLHHLLTTLLLYLTTKLTGLLPRLKRVYQAEKSNYYTWYSSIERRIALL